MSASARRVTKGDEELSVMSFKKHKQATNQTQHNLWEDLGYKFICNIDSERIIH